MGVDIGRSERYELSPTIDDVVDIMLSRQFGRLVIMNDSVADDSATDRFIALSRGGFACMPVFVAAFFRVLHFLPRFRAVHDRDLREDDVQDFCTVDDRAEDERVAVGVRGFPVIEELV